MKLLKQTLPKVFNSGVSEISYDKDSLMETLIRDKRQPKKIWKIPVQFPYRNLIRFVLLMTVLVAVVILVLTLSIYYVKDIVLFKSKLSVNQQGVFMPTRSCGRDYCLFLFNTSELWSNTGIYLNKGDKYKISVSGAFHSSVEHLRSDAENNNSTPEVRWITGLGRDTLFRSSFIPQQNKKDFFVSDESYLGAVLFRIAPEYIPWEIDATKGKHITQWKPEYGKKLQAVKEAGILSLAINDIYFDGEADLRRYADANHYRFKYTRFDPDAILHQRDSLTSLGVRVDLGRMLYEDNIGQILVCLEIQHPLPGGIFNPFTAFRWLDNQMEQRADAHEMVVGRIWSMLWCGLFFLWWISIIFIVYVVSILFIVYFLFMASYWFYLLTKKIIQFLEIDGCCAKKLLESFKKIIH